MVVEQRHGPVGIAGERRLDDEAMLVVPARRICRPGLPREIAIALRLHEQLVAEADQDLRAAAGAERPVERAMRLHPVARDPFATARRPQEAVVAEQHALFQGPPPFRMDCRSATSFSQQRVRVSSSSSASVAGETKKPRMSCAVTSPSLASRFSASRTGLAATA